MNNVWMDGATREQIKEVQRCTKSDKQSNWQDMQHHVTGGRKHRCHQERIQMFSLLFSVNST